jgi:cyclic pyranopterin phosphate synthase
MMDRFGRELKTLRVSVTDRCDLRCSYCMPAQGAVFAPRKELLETSELLRALGIFHGLGIRRLKFTGGEPLLRTDLEELLAFSASRFDISLTSNGTLLSGRAEGLWRSGLRRLTVSMDTLHPGNYARITRGGDLRRVKDGLKAASQLGFSLKLNAVLMDQSREELLQLAALSVSSPWEIRFIEYMPVSAGVAPQEGLLSPEGLLEILRQGFGELEELGRERPAAPATRLRIKGAQGSIGLIRSVSEPFCKACDRLRLQADGFLRLCMARPEGLKLGGLLRSAATDAEISAAVAAAAYEKPAGHAFYSAAPESGAAMSSIGG